MRKFLILALFVLGMYNVYACPDCEAPALDAAQEIILTEVYNIMPLDDPENDIHEGTPDPNRFYASIDGNLLFVGAYTDAPAYVEVINQDTGEVVVEEYFEGEAEVIIEQTGWYIVQIYSAYIAVAGDFEVQ